MKIIATALLLALAASAVADERGLPLIEIRDQRRHGAGAQVFDVTQAPDGMLYFGGLEGVTTYDGAWWRSMPLPNNSAVFSIESGRGPELAVGAVDELGWVAPDPAGTLVFHSLRPFLPEEQRDVGDVRAICTTGSGFLYVAEHLVLAWSGGAPRVVADLRERPATMARCFRGRNTTWVTLGTGLHRYDESARTLVSAGFAGKTVDAVLPFGNRDLVVVRGEGLYAGGTPFQSAANEWLRGKTITTAAALPGNRFLLGSAEEGVLILDGNGALEQRLDSGAGLPRHVLSGSTVDRESSLWLTYHGSIARLELDSPSETALPQPPPLIRRAVADDKPVLAPLHPAFGRIRIEFAPASYRPGVVYQYRLDPADAKWSAWTAQPSIDYTNLDHGHYTFRVRARNAAGIASGETRWSFSVQPPWYRTGAALAGWLLLAAIAMAAIVRLRTAALTRQAQRLRALVEERTEELQQANANLERLSLLDELTGIANRRYFQRALVEEWRNAHEQQQPVALVLFDLDYFKQLNDRYGHAAGDAALIRVARHLSRRSRRSGDFTRTKDVVARIGGEEFAVVLPGSTEEEAMRVADTLRAGIERLPIELTGSTVHVTASAGVAAVIPRDAESWNTLLRDADRALYGAKAAGRNRVQAWSAGENPSPPASYAPVQT